MNRTYQIVGSIFRFKFLQVIDLYSSFLVAVKFVCWGFSYSKNVIR